MSFANQHIGKEKGDDTLKYIAFVIIGAAVVLLLVGKKGSGCAQIIEESCHLDVNLFEGMGMSIEPETLTPFGAVIAILNATVLDIESGSEAAFELQQLRDGKWHCMQRHTEPPDEQLHAYGYLQGMPMTLRLDWTEAYGPLSPGHYRIVKRFYEYQGEGAKRYFFLADEFDI